MRVQNRSFRKLLVLGLIGFAACAAFELHAASPLGDSKATTESSCSFGMEKNMLKQTCQVPIPPGCIVAHFPGTTKPWTTISKGGDTQCRFDAPNTDWTTRITGTCTKCKTGRCSAQFQVRFDCSATMPAPVTQTNPRPGDR